MLKTVVWRIVQFPLILAIIYLLTFALAWMAPGSPFEAGDRKIDPMAEKTLREQFHADKWYKFLGYYPYRILRYGDLGRSMRYQGFTVNEIIGQSLPVSVALGIFALSVATLAGIGVGTLAAVRRGGLFDWLSLSLAMVGISLPSFVAASLLLTLFSVHWPVFPIGRFESLADLVLPGIALSLIPMAYIARLTRVSMIDVLSNDYVRTARAKGLARWAVIWKHCLRNALLPVLSYLGPAAAATFTGSFVVEKVFDIPGLGQHFVNGVRNRDQTLILGAVMVYSLFLMSFNLLVDIGYTVVDPRIELSKDEG